MIMYFQMSNTVKNNLTTELQMAKEKNYYLLIKN
jgi:hypothetical protein